MTRFEKAVDKALAEYNRRFLNDPVAIEAAEAQGDRARLQLEAEGILPPTDPIHRLRWLPIYMGEGIPYRCSHCHLLKDDHVRDGIILWCAEWRLRQMYGDR